jgi:hypothetical protein
MINTSHWLSWKVDVLGLICKTCALQSDNVANPDSNPEELQCSQKVFASLNLSLFPLRGGLVLLCIYFQKI